MTGRQPQQPPRRSVRRPPHAALTAAGAALLLAGCHEELPTAQSDDLVRAGVAVEVTLPAREFLDRVRVFGGYGRTSELGGGFVAHQFGADAGPDAGQGLEAATLIRFSRYPSVITVTDTAGTSRPDSSLTFLSGRIVARFDTLASVRSGPVAIDLHATTEPWDPWSANWANAVDTAQHLVPWSTPGGGALRELATAVWDPEAGDSLVVAVDSAQLAAWADTLDPVRGLRLGTREPGVRLQMRSARMWLDTRPSLNPDTIVDALASAQYTTFIYSPMPERPAQGMRVGGVPAWRTVLDLNLPRTLTGPPSLCADLGCPVEITADRVSYAALHLTTTAEEAAFAPSDTLSMDLRMVMVPDILPKSPLGPSRTPLAGVILSPEWFAPPAGRVVEVPVTELVRDLLRGETAEGDATTETIALLASFEPLSIEYASFAGLNGGAAEPRLSMILNFSRGGN